MLRPDDEVRVLAGLDRPDALVEVQLLRRVDRHQLERLLLGQAAPVHHLRGLGVEAARVLGAVRVDRHHHAGLHHDRGVVGDRVDRLHLEAPPVGEGADAGAVRGQLLRHLVALQAVLESGDLEAELLGHAQHHQHLVGAVRVDVRQSLPLHHLDERLELQVAARRDHVLARLLPRGVGLPLALVCLRPGERVADDELDAGPARRVALRPRGRAGGPHRFRVLAERELQARHAGVEHHVLGARFPPAQLDDGVGAADRVGAAVEHAGHGDAARQVPVDVHVERVEHVQHVGHRADRRPPLVGGVLGDVRVLVHDARRDELAGRVHHLGARGHVEAGADRGDLAAPDDDHPVRDGALGDSEDRPALDDDRRGGASGRRLRLQGRGAGQGGGRQECQDRPSEDVSRSHACLHGKTARGSRLRAQGHVRPAAERRMPTALGAGRR